MKAYQRVIDGIIFFESNDTSAATVIKTKEEYDKHFVERYGWSKTPTIKDILEDEPGLKEIYNKVVDYFSKGYSIFCKNVDYNDDSLTSLIETIVEDNENFVILEREEL